MGSLNQHGLDEAGFPELCLSLFPSFPPVPSHSKPGLLLIFSGLHADLI